MRHKQINDLLPTPQFKHNNEKLLFGYLTACGVNFSFQKLKFSELVEDLTINFELQIGTYTLFIELLETPSDALKKKAHYKHHFSYPPVFLIECAIPTHVFYEQLVSIFTSAIPLNIIPRFDECKLHFDNDKL